MWIGKYVTGNVRDRFEILRELLQMIEDDVKT
jgi:hypothetical protein